MRVHFVSEHALWVTCVSHDGSIYPDMYRHACILNNHDMGANDLDQSVTVLELHKQLR